MKVATELRAGIHAGHHNLARCIGHPGVDSPRRFDLACGEAVCGPACRAFELVEFEPFDRALARVADQAIGQAIEHVAGPPGVGFQHGNGFQGQRMALLPAGVFDRRGEQAGDQIHRRRASDDAIEVIRVAQRFHQRAMAPLGTAPKIGVLHVSAIELGNDPLGQHGRQMVGPKAEVDLRVVIPVEAGIIRPVVPGVGRGHGKALIEQAGGVADHAGKATGRVEHQSPGPTLDGHGDPEANRAVNGPIHTAMGRCIARGRHQHAWVYRLAFVREPVQPIAARLRRIRTRTRVGCSGQRHPR